MLLLIVILSAQLTVFSSFHHVYISGVLATNYTVITVAKFSSVDARVEISVMPIVTNGVSEVTLTLPNGTSIELNNLNGRTFSFSASLPSGGYSSAYGIAAGPIPINLSPSHPLEVLIQGNVSNVAGYERSLGAESGGGVQLYFFVIHGNAMVSAEAYGVGA